MMVRVEIVPALCAGPLGARIFRLADGRLARLLAPEATPRKWDLYPQEFIELPATDLVARLAAAAWYNECTNRTETAAAVVESLGYSLPRCLGGRCPGAVERW